MESSFRVQMMIVQEKAIRQPTLTGRMEQPKTTAHCLKIAEVLLLNVLCVTLPVRSRRGEPIGATQ